MTLGGCIIDIKPMHRNIDSLIYHTSISTIYTRYKMKEFFNYFFGAGEEIEFTNFGLSHFLPILLMVGVIVLIYLYRDKLASLKNEKTVRMALAFTLIITEMSYFWRLVGVSAQLGPNAVDHLPITVCGWCVIFCSYLSVTKSQSLFDIAYFWLFSGTIFALITPTVISYTGPTRFRYYQFWLEHTLGYITIFYMIFVHKMRPTVKSAIKSFLALTVLGGVAILANTVLGPGANYLFLAKPEDTPSILDILPPNYGLRIFIMVLAVSLMFAVAYLPWFFKDGKKLKFSIEN